MQELRQLHWLHPADDSGGKFAHVVRTSLRCEQWATLSHRLDSFSGMLYGVDRAATMALHKMLGGLERYRLRCVLTGALQTSYMRHLKNPEVDPTCRCCGQALETLAHLFDECETLSHIRYREIWPSTWVEFPDCMRLHGIVPAKFGTASERLTFGCAVQHTLLDMWEHRCTFAVDEQPPVARWQKRPRLS